MSTLQPPPIQDVKKIPFSLQSWFNQLRNYVALIQSTSTTISRNLTTANEYVKADSTGGAITLTLPPANSKKRLHIKRINAGANNVTIQRAGSDTIEGAVNVVLAAQYKSYTLWADGNTTWYIEAAT